MRGLEALWCTFDMVGVSVVLLLAVCQSFCSVDQLCSGHRVWLIWCRPVEKMKNLSISRSTEPLNETIFRILVQNAVPRERKLKLHELRYNRIYSRAGCGLAIATF